MSLASPWSPLSSSSGSTLHFAPMRYLGRSWSQERSFESVSLLTEKVFFLLALKGIDNMGFAVKLDSNGTNPKKIEEIIQKKLVDYILVKHPNNDAAKALLINLPTSLSVEPAWFLLNNLEKTCKSLILGLRS